MASQALQNLSIAGPIAGTDLFYLKQSGARGVQGSGAQVAEFIRDTVAGFAVGGSNISIVHNDAGDTLTFSFTGSLTGDTITIDNSGFVVLTATDDQALWEEADALFDDTLRASNNLSDLSNVATARANLGVRETLAANRTYYVNASTGSDSNNGLSSGAPFLTIQKAVDVMSTLDGGGIYTGTIEVADGTYNEVVILRNLIGFVSVTIQGGTAAGCVLNGQTITAFRACFYGEVGGVGRYIIDRFTLSPGSASTAVGVISADSAIAIEIKEVRFDRCIRSAIEAAGPSALIRVTGPITDISTSTATSFLYSRNGAFLVWNNSGISPDLTISGTPTYTYWAFCDMVSQMQIFNFTFSVTGSVTGPRFFVKNASIINTNAGGATYLPGSTAGTEETSTSGHYV